MIPNFVCIGVPRGGTTWLYETMMQHPDVAMSRHTKEIHFFDRRYDQGLAWYERFFPPDEDAGRYRAVGEVTPHYLYRPQVPKRIFETRPDMRLLLLLRDPVKRAFSHYLFRKRMDNFDGCFQQFIDAYPTAVEWGRYADHLPRFLDQFPRQQLLVLFNERMFSDIPATLQQICAFLGLDAGRFPPGAGEGRVNETAIPLMGPVFRRTVRIGGFLRRHDLDKLAHFLARRLRLRQLFGLTNRQKTEAQPELSEAEHTRVYDRYFADSVERLESLLDVRLDDWKPQPTPEPERV